MTVNWLTIEIGGANAKLTYRNGIITSLEVNLRISTSCGLVGSARVVI